MEWTSLLGEGRDKPPIVARKTQRGVDFADSRGERPFLDRVSFTGICCYTSPTHHMAQVLHRALKKVALKRL